MDINKVKIKQIETQKIVKQFDNVFLPKLVCLRSPQRTQETVPLFASINFERSIQFTQRKSDPSKKVRRDRIDNLLDKVIEYVNENELKQEKNLKRKSTICFQ
ncbi:hypothetical protein SS50377_28029 [Spironucleus salmonicida]|uniref:Uncharacterized protein n=1 Tax=Spironucleus salmonicida TaxID=348837 RepID=A0A9P8LKU9_9EUKA|nr:hypothetical protein SS50377_28029 [Spironucleus salmonicida]